VGTGLKAGAPAQRGVEAGGGPTNYRCVCVCVRVCMCVCVRVGTRLKAGAPALKGVEAEGGPNNVNLEILTDYIGRHHVAYHSIGT